MPFSLIRFSAYVRTSRGWLVLCDRTVTLSSCVVVLFNPANVEKAVVVVACSELEGCAANNSDCCWISEYCRMMINDVSH